MDQPAFPKGRLVLIGAAASPGTSRRPPVTAATTCHGDTAPMTPSRRRAAAAHAPTTSTASPTTLERTGSGPVNGSNCTNSTVKTDRAVSALRANARSQPRTVESGAAAAHPHHGPTGVGHAPTGPGHPRTDSSAHQPEGDVRPPRHRCLP
jgi:hypothetical protein